MFFCQLMNRISRSDTEEIFVGKEFSMTMTLNSMNKRARLVTCRRSKNTLFIKQCDLAMDHDQKVSKYFENVPSP